MTLLTNFSFAMMPVVILLRIHPGRMAFALGIIIPDKLLALADKAQDESATLLHSRPVTAVERWLRPGRGLRG
jgi:hypothetical protein